ncbi:MAG TPA: hypothetical protein VJ716_04365 [Gaiellaceae bacterium]|nr:hypothetical protein [Gaiellaceae bacterium]
MIVARRVVGAVLFLTGAVWIGQGTGAVTGSSMTGSTFWAVVGAVCVVAGLVLLGWPWRQPRSDP